MPWHRGIDTFEITGCLLASPRLLPTQRTPNWLQSPGSSAPVPLRSGVPRGGAGTRGAGGCLRHVELAGARAPRPSLASRPPGGESGDGGTLLRRWREGRGVAVTGTVTPARSLPLGRLTARSHPAEHRTGTACAGGVGWGGGEAVHISERGAAPMGARRQARKHPSGLLSWCGREQARQRGGGQALERRWPRAGRPRGHHRSHVPQLGKGQRAAGSPATPRGRATLPARAPRQGHRVPRGLAWQREGQRGRRAETCRKEGGMGGKEGAGDPGHAPAGQRWAAAGSGGCSITQTKAGAEAAAGCGSLGRGCSLLGSPTPPPLPS